MSQKRVLVAAGAVFTVIVMITLAFAVRQELQGDRGGDAVAGASSTLLVPRRSARPLSSANRR